MQKFIWKAEGMFCDEHGHYYAVTEVDEVLKRQAAAAISGMNAAKAISSGQLEQAHRLHAESSPAVLESERQANAILTARASELESELDTMNLAVGYFHEENDKFITRIGDLEQACKENARYSQEMREEFERRGARIEELECGIKGCPLPKYHHHLPDTHPHRWCKPPGRTS